VGAKCANDILQGRDLDEANTLNLMNFEPSGGNYTIFLKRLT